MATSNEIDKPNKTVLEKILDWSKGRPLWQRDALKHILQKNQITDQDIEDFLKIIKNEKAGKLDELSLNPLSEDDLPSNPGADTSVNITKLSNISYVNNLADDQELAFSNNGISVIYGGNGSGKSGYTRILKSACRARHRDRILTNIFAPEFRNETPTANITYLSTSKPEETVGWEDSDKPHKVLSAVSVFDRECATIHIQKKGNEIAFRPYGLDVPDTLADVCKRVENELRIELTDLKNGQNAIFRNPPWSDKTVSGKSASNITKLTNQKDLEKAYKFTDDDNIRLNYLTEILSKDIQITIQEELTKAERLVRFKNNLLRLTARLSKNKLDNLLKQGTVALELSEATKVAACKMLDGDVLPEIGGEIWKHLWFAAKEYSINVAYPGKPFPNTEDNSKCVLCNQYLGEEAKERMKVFEKHISGELEKKSKEEEEAFELLYRQSIFANIKFTDYREILEDIGYINPDLQKQVRRYLASIRLRQNTFKKIANKIPGTELSAYSRSPFIPINKQVKDYKTSAKELQNATNDDGIDKLTTEKNELQDRKHIKENKKVILDEIKRLREIEFIQACLKETNTNSITRLGNKIADEVITPNIKDRFKKEIVDLVGNRVQVEFIRSGGSSGSPNYKLILQSSPGTNLSTVLSEGEQNCVAIAAFLAELATSSHKSALIFDDPVSSLDHNWRHKVADRLVEEARKRQVIVFTHDLVFLNDINESSKTKGVNFVSRHLTRTPNKVGLVNDKLPWIGMGIKARIDALEKEARYLCKIRDELTQEKYNDLAGAFFGKLRASWERALEEVGLCNTVVRFRDYINPRDILKLSALSITSCEDWSTHFSRCCKYVSAHDPSNARNQLLPEPSQLLEECNILSKWIDSVKESQKSVIPA